MSYLPRESDPAGIESQLWYPPATANADDDEFDTDPIDGAWVVRSGGARGPFAPDGDTVWGPKAAGNYNRNYNDKRPSWIQTQATGVGTGGSQMFMTKRLSSTIPDPFLVYARLRCEQSLPQSVAAVGSLALIIGENVAPENVVSSINYMAQIMYTPSFGVPATDPHMPLSRVQSGTRTTVATTGSPITKGMVCDSVALHRVGSSIYGWVGGDGGWIRQGSLTHGGLANFDHIGFWFWDGGGRPAAVHGFDYIRVLTGFSTFPL